MSSRNILVIVILVAVIGACQKSSDEAQSNNSVSKYPESSALFGKWKGNCQVWGSGEYQTSGVPILTIDVSGLSLVTESYRGGTCSGDIYDRTKMEMEFLVEGVSSTSPDTYDVIAAARKITWIMFDQDQVNAANTGALCGFTDWVIDVEKDVSGLSCFTGPKIGEKVYSIVRIRNSQFFFGDSDDKNNGTTPELRHKIIDEKKFFVKF